MNYPEPPSGHSMHGAHHIDTPPEHAREELYSKAPPHLPKKSTIRDCKPRNLDPLDFAPHPINYYNRLHITKMRYSSFHFHFLFHSPYMTPCHVLSPRSLPLQQSTRALTLVPQVQAAHPSREPDTQRLGCKA